MKGQLGLLLNPVVFYGVVILLGVLMLGLVFPFFGAILVSAFVKLAFIVGGFVGAFLILKEVMNKKVPVIKGLFQAGLILVLGFLIPNFLSKLGMQSIVLPMMSATDGNMVTLPFDVQVSHLWVFGVVLFLLYLTKEGKIKGFCCK